MTRAQIIGTGGYAPEKVMTNHDLAKIVETSDEWIVERTGIRSRHVAAEGELTSDMALKASLRALEMAKVHPDELDMIVMGTISPDMPMPASAAFLAHKLKATKCFAFDVSAACAGSLFGMSIATQFIVSGAAKKVLVVGAELLTRGILDWQDRNTCVLFGDAAGAMVLSASVDGKRGVMSTHLHTDGSVADILWIRGGGTLHPLSQETLDKKLHKVQMNGREVFKFAVRALTESVKEALEHNGITADHVVHVIAHQANTRILDAVLERLGIAKEKAWLNIEKYGNTSAASLPMTLDEANRAGRLKEGDLIVMMAIGSGMSWGSALVRW
ncbi:MAG: ketoacyl-ACP synthase III [Myxococcaceae bacterium]|nr:ketoacyl-ACP synthase III [Myxococcaceae bacterium]